MAELKQLKLDVEGTPRLLTAGTYGTKKDGTPRLITTTDVGHLTCPLCNQKLTLIHRDIEEPSKTFRKHTIEERYWEDG